MSGRACYGRADHALTVSCLVWPCPPVMAAPCLLRRACSWPCPAYPAVLLMAVLFLLWPCRACYGPAVPVMAVPCRAFRAVLVRPGRSCSGRAVPVMAVPCLLRLRHAPLAVFLWPYLSCYGRTVLVMAVSCLSRPCPACYGSAVPLVTGAVPVVSVPCPCLSGRACYCRAVHVTEVQPRPPAAVRVGLWGRSAGVHPADRYGGRGCDRSGRAAPSTHPPRFILSPESSRKVPLPGKPSPPRKAPGKFPESSRNFPGTFWKLPESSRKQGRKKKKCAKRSAQNKCAKEVRKNGGKPKRSAQKRPTLTTRLSRKSF